MDLNNIREDIDHVDAELTRLLEKRLNLVCQVAAFKKLHQLPVLDEKREQRLLEKIAAQIENPEFSDTIIDTYKQILKNSRDFQTKMLR